MDRISPEELGRLVGVSRGAGTERAGKSGLDPDCRTQTHPEASAEGLGSVEESSIGFLRVSTTSIQTPTPASVLVRCRMLKRLLATWVASASLAGVMLCASPLLADGGEFLPKGVYVLNPLHPDECAAAWSEAAYQLELDSQSFHWRRVRAEAVLCDGLARSDPGALIEAAIQFRSLAEEARDDLDVLIGLADAVRRRFPASPEAADALTRALASVSPEASDLRTYLGSNLASVLQNLEACPKDEDGGICIQRGQADLDRALSRSLDLDSARGLVERAEILYLAGRFREAIENYQQALEPQQRGLTGEEKAAVADRLKQAQELLRRPHNHSPGGK